MSTLDEVREVCPHMETMRSVTPDSPDSCPECVSLGEVWVHLRECQTCGHVGCCDSSRNQHATGHRNTTGHPIVRSFEPGESWWYCYDDDIAFEIDGIGPARAG